MRDVLSREVNAVQNEALAAVLLWRFGGGYKRPRDRCQPTTPVPVLFVVLPLLFDEETATIIASTKKGSGLRFFAAKFAESSIRRWTCCFHSKGVRELFAPDARSSGPRQRRASCFSTSHQVKSPLCPQGACTLLPMPFVPWCVVLRSLAPGQVPVTLRVVDATLQSRVLRASMRFHIREIIVVVEVVGA